jgi:hypothetical protein
MAALKESWLARWSRRKLAEGARQEHAQGPKPSPVGACAEASEAVRAGAPAAQATLGEADLVTLNAQSDYTPFLKQGVRAEVRSAALRRLWSSEPIFSQVDGLQDYAGDFTDRATIPSGPVATAYRVGWGIAGHAPGQEDGRDPVQPVQSGGAASETDQKPESRTEHSRAANTPLPSRGLREEG